METTAPNEIGKGSPDLTKPDSGDIPIKSGQLQCFASHKVSCVAISADGRLVLTGCEDGLVYLWDVETGDARICTDSHKGAVRCVAFSPDGAQAASGGIDGVVRFWNTKDGATRTCEGQPYEILAIAFVNQGRGLLTGAASGEPNPDAPDGPTDGMIRLWYTPVGNETDGKEDKRYRGLPNPVDCMAFAGNPRRVLVAGAPVMVGQVSTPFFVFDPLTGKPIRAFQADDLGVVHSIAASASGAQAVTCGDDGDVRLWDVNTGKEVRKFSGHTGAVWCAAFSPKGDRLLTGGDDDTVRLWDVTTAKELRRFTGHKGAVRGVVFSTDGTRAVSGGDDRTARVWDLSK